ncbi:MAG: EF-hand domain-containing protein [Gammaproteobacteria bacterium]|nr:EF-hand domain-containing protein [Gammaproteobacteria bacterium]
MKNWLILPLAVYSATAFAVTDAFSILDTNDDNAISREEAESLPGLVNHWNELDINADDRLSYSEFQAYAKTSDLGSSPDIDAQTLDLN